ncbi:MAG: hypothetical protein ACTSX9_00330 [Candidatus Njordarchaeales archaeon]
MSSRGRLRRKRKFWITVYAPELLGGTNRPLAKVLCSEPEDLINRIVLVKGIEFTKDFEDRGMNLYFRIVKVTPSGAFTTLIGHDYVREVISSKVRRRMSRVEIITHVYTKDGHRVKVSILAMTAHRCKEIHKKLIRKIFEEFLITKAKEYSYEEFIYHLAIAKTWHAEMIRLAHKIYPLREFLIYKSRAETVIVPSDEIEKAVEQKEEIGRRAETFTARR